MDVTCCRGAKEGHIWRIHHCFALLVVSVSLPIRAVKQRPLEVGKSLDTRPSLMIQYTCRKQKHVGSDLDLSDPIGSNLQAPLPGRGFPMRRKRFAVYFIKSLLETTSSKYLRISAPGA